MANIPDQVDAALMAKLRLQSQSPGEEERRLGVGWAWLRGAGEDGGRRHDGGRRRGVAKERTPLCPLSNPPMDGHWLALVQGFRTDGRLDAMLAKRAFSRTADGRVGKGRRRQGMRWRGRSAQRPRLEAESNNSVGERTAACGVSGCACGWAEAHGAIEALDAHATDEGGTCSRATGTRARSLVVVGRSVEGGRGGRWSSTGHSTATVEVKCGGGRIERQVHGSFGGLARRPGESQGAKPYGKHQRKWIATLLSAAVFFKENGPEHGHMDNYQVCRSTRTAIAVPSNTSLSGLGWCDTPPS